MTNQGMVKAKLVDDIEAPGTPDGAFEYFQEQGKTAGMVYICPCGCKAQGALDFKPARSPSWKWDGNIDEPTLYPSVHHIIAGVTHWHGWLKKGMWVSV